MGREPRRPDYVKRKVLGSAAFREARAAPNSFARWRVPVTKLGLSAARLEHNRRVNKRPVHTGLSVRPRQYTVVAVDVVVAVVFVVAVVMVVAVAVVEVAVVLVRVVRRVHATLFAHMRTQALDSSSQKSGVIDLAASTALHVAGQLYRRLCAAGLLPSQAPSCSLAAQVAVGSSWHAPVGL